MKDTYWHRIETIINIFDTVRNELYNPPITLDKVIIRKKLGDSIKFYLKYGRLTLFIGEKFFKLRNWGKILCWIFRHQLAHIHYCPYDLKTAYSLQRQAYQVIRDWKLAFYVVSLFSDLMVDVVYLLRFFREIPAHLEYRFRKFPSGLDMLTYSAYKAVFGDLLPEYDIDLLLEEYGKDVVAIVLSQRSWFSKVRLLASLLLRLAVLQGDLALKKEARKTELGIIPVIEDLQKDERSIRDVYAQIIDEAEAKAFYEQWIKPRKENENEIKHRLRHALRKTLKRYKEQVSKERISLDVQTLGGEEPRLSTSLSKPLKKLKEKLEKEAMWRRYWYRARAEQALIELVELFGLQRPQLREDAYPEQWCVDDDIEDLDIELSVTEGRLIPEVTTAKWVQKRLSIGAKLSESSVPSMVIALDSSKSMLSIFNSAAVAAFILFLSARKSGGNVAVVNFSTKYISCDWDETDDLKELVLSIPQGNYTIFPYPELDYLLKSAHGEVIISIITDGGWQNFDESVAWIKEKTREGLHVVIFHIYGWKYEKNIKILKEKSGAQVFEIKKPEEDLKKYSLLKVREVYGLPVQYYWIP